MLQPILEVKTSKQWHLPPRPKSARLRKDDRRRKELVSAPEENLQALIDTVTRENAELKEKLLLLVHDYKLLRLLMLSDGLYSEPTAAHKRLFAECDGMSGLISDMTHLLHRSPAPEDEEVFSFLKLHDSDSEDGIPLSPTVSPCLDELLALLTRLTTVSSVGYEKRPLAFDLPAYTEEYVFAEHMLVIEEDNYNRVADLLEEKLMSNDVRYYTEQV